MSIKYKTMVFVLVSSLLTGCVAAIVTGAVAGMVYDRRSVVTMEADARLFHLIHSAIVSHPQFRDSRVVVTSFNRVVLLAGQTPTSSSRALAEQIARKTPGVFRVHNELSLVRPIELSERSEDTWITSQVRSNMLAKKGLESGSIRIVTENKVVFLMGIVNAQQAALAAESARRVNGVSKVVKIFQYIR
jgi:osmotically-inducible protein OsmY